MLEFHKKGFSQCVLSFNVLLEFHEIRFNFEQSDITMSESHIQNSHFYQQHYDPHKMMYISKDLIHQNQFKCLNFPMGNVNNISNFENKNPMFVHITFSYIFKHDNNIGSGHYTSFSNALLCVMHGHPPR